MGSGVDVVLVRGWVGWGCGSVGDGVLGGW